MLGVISSLALCGKGSWYKKFQGEMGWALGEDTARSLPHPLGLSGVLLGSLLEAFCFARNQLQGSLTYRSGSSGVWAAQEE